MLLFFLVFEVSFLRLLISPVSCIIFQKWKSKIQKLCLLKYYYESEVFRLFMKWNHDFFVIFCFIKSTISDSGTLINCVNAPWSYTKKNCQASWDNGVLLVGCPRHAVCQCGHGLAVTNVMGLWRFRPIGTWLVNFLSQVLEANYSVLREETRFSSKWPKFWIR